MHHVIIYASVLAGLAIAAPYAQPQEIDLSGVIAAGGPEIVTPPADVVSEVVTLLPTSSIAPITTDPAKLRKRVTKRDACQPEPAGSGPSVSPDSPEAFTADPTLQAFATGATKPDGYNQVFSNQGGSVSASNYMGLNTLTSYDTLTCASLCDQAAGCLAFNIYIERNPSIDPAAACPNPPSTTNFKCTLWGVPVTVQEATNTGQWRNDFHVVITGSNAYNKAAPPAPISGFSDPVALGGSINAPDNSYMGYQYFPFSQSQGYTPQTCASACLAQTQYNLDHPSVDCTYAPCVFFDAYVLSDNGIPQGLYCTMYNKTWAPSYATNYGQMRGSDRYTVSQSYSYSLLNPPAQPAYTPKCGGSFIADGGFEDVSGGFPFLGPWTAQETGDVTAQSGWSLGYNSNYMFGASLYGSNPSPSVLLQQTLTTVPGVNYAFSMFYRIDYDMDVCVINLGFPDGTTHTISMAGKTPEVFYASDVYTFVGGGDEKLTINPYCDVGAGGEIFIDDVEVYLSH